jgi:hypothetical protein
MNERRKSAAAVVSAVGKPCDLVKHERLRMCQMVQCTAEARWLDRVRLAPQATPTDTVHWNTDVWLCHKHHDDLHRLPPGTSAIVAHQADAGDGSPPGRRE